jgi:hypothetical protein
MSNPIIEEVRAARAALAAEHGYDIRRITDWAREQTAARKRALGDAGANRPLETTGGATKSPVKKKRRARPARV